MAHALGATKSGCVNLGITHSEKKIIHKIGQIREFLGSDVSLGLYFLNIRHIIYPLCYVTQVGLLSIVI